MEESSESQPVLKEKKMKKRSSPGNEQMSTSSKKKCANKLIPSTDKTDIVDHSSLAPIGDPLAGQNLKIVPAICSVCRQSIPNLFDVTDTSVESTELDSSVFHKCERCATPLETHKEFVFGGIVHQKSVEEIVIVSDEENSPKIASSTKKEQIISKERVSNERAKHFSICEEPKLNEVITLSSSSSAEEDDQIVMETSKRSKSKKGKKESRKKQNERSNILRKEDLSIHPKYKLYEMSKSLPPQKLKCHKISEIDLRENNVSPIFLDDVDDADYLKTNRDSSICTDINQHESKTTNFKTESNDVALEKENGIIVKDLLENMLNSVVKYEAALKKSDKEVKGTFDDCSSIRKSVFLAKESLKDASELIQITSKNFEKHHDNESNLGQQKSENSESKQSKHSININGIASTLCEILNSKNDDKTVCKDRKEENDTTKESEKKDDETVEYTCNTSKGQNENMETEMESNYPETVLAQWEFVDNKESPNVLSYSKNEFKSSHENYLRGCYWSPDGNILLTNSNDNILRVFDTDDKSMQNYSSSEDSGMIPKSRLREGETVYDLCWYPYQQASDPDTCCFLTTSRDHPVHLWDTNTGRIRCSYRAFDQMDEIASAHSVSFNNDGSKIYCGFNNCIRIFDSARPGRQFREQSIIPKKNRHRKGHGQRCLNQRGIVSSIAFSNQYNGLYALGTFSKTVGLYSSNGDEPLFLLREHTGGITQLKFTSDGFYLFSGARKDNELIAWDMRNTSMPLFKVRRNVKTNQRILFDIDPSCKYLCSGGTDNSVSVWNINDIMLNVGDDVITHDPLFSFVGHEDAVNGVSIHPSSSKIATASGQRHFYVDDADSDETDDQDDSLTLTNDDKKQGVCHDNSLTIWNCMQSLS